MTLDHLPQAVWPRIVRGTIIKEDCPAKVVGAQDHPRAHHPTDIRQPEEPIVRTVIEREPYLLGGLNERAGVSVNSALRLPGSAGRVKQHRRGFRIQSHCFARCGSVLPRGDDADWQSFRSFANFFFEWQNLAPTLQRAGGEDGEGSGIRQARSDRTGAKSSEDGNRHYTELQAGI